MTTSVRDKTESATIEAPQNGDTPKLRDYSRNKLRTIFQIVQSVRNWPDALEMRIWRHRPCLRLLEFRDGLNVIFRGGTNEWSVVHELLFANSYEKALGWLAARREPNPYVLDLGGNIGLFSLLAARSNPRAKVVTFEPGPPNFRMFRMNMLANPDLGRRVELREMAMAGSAGEAVWNFDAENPGGSSLQLQAGALPPNPTKVKLASFADALAEAPGEIALVKMDIEGAEWDILAKTPDEAWKRIQAINVRRTTSSRR
jgi:FkbM family methyltransferase